MLTSLILYPNGYFTSKEGNSASNNIIETSSVLIKLYFLQTALKVITVKGLKSLLPIYYVNEVLLILIFLL